MESLESRMVRVETQIASFYSLIKWGGGIFATVTSTLLAGILVTLIRK